VVLKFVCTVKHMARVRQYRPSAHAKSVPVHVKHSATAKAKHSAKASAKHAKPTKPLRIPLRKGTLTKHGYSTHDPQVKRRAALRRAVKSEGWLPVFRKLNAVAIYSKHKSAGAVFLKDRDYVKRQFSGK